jgi:membrane fusion protein, multidrug efflux system
MAAMARRLLSATLGSLAALAMACSQGSPLQGSGAGAGAPVPVRVATVERRDAPLEIHTIGTVQAYSTVTIKPQIAGQIASTHFSEGREVRRGERLFTLDPRPFEAELAQAQGNLARDLAQAENARTSFRRIDELFSERVVSRGEYDQARAQRDSLEAAVKADSAAVEDARVRLQYCSIESPLDGRVGQILVHAGNVVKEHETPLAVVNQIRPIYVSFALPERELDEVRRRMAEGPLSVEATPAREGAGGVGLQGTLSFVDNAVDLSTGTVLLKALFANEGETLWPGQFVDVALTLSVTRGAVVAPTQAISTGQQGAYAFVVKPDETVEIRPVVVARRSGEQAIVESGLRPGERVVTDGQLRLAAGAKVTIQEALAPAEKTPSTRPPT